MDSFTRKQNIRYLLLIGVTTLSVLALSLVYSSGQLKKEKKFKLTDMTVTQASEFLKSNKDSSDVVILDIRTPGEYNEGHLKGSTHINYYAEDFKKKLSKLDRNKIYLLYSKTGRICSKVIKKMRRLKFREAHNITGGIKEWKAENLPVSR